MLTRPFTNSEHSELLTMWRAGIPASTIASTLNRTRNSILGYVHRLRRTMPELQRVATTKREKRNVTSIPQEQRLKRAKPIPVVQVNAFTPIVEEAPPEGGVPYFETRRSQCKYLLNTSRDIRNVKCCGGAVYMGMSWCRHHYIETHQST